MDLMAHQIMLHIERGDTGGGNTNESSERMKKEQEVQTRSW